MIILASRDEKELLSRLRSIEAKDKASTLLEEKERLKAQINELKNDKSVLEEKHQREERELRHMIGLEKKRQEFEIEQAKKQTALQVREENLVADRKRFEEHLKFNTERFEKLEAYLKDMISDILKRLPNVNLELTRELENGRRR